jgi:hypothetical protein
VRPDGEGIEELVGDRGYHSNQSLIDLEAVGVPSYISEPDRERRNWKKSPDARDAVYRNRRRIHGRPGPPQRAPFVLQLVNIVRRIHTSAFNTDDFHRPLTGPQHHPERRAVSQPLPRERHRASRAS